MAELNNEIAKMLVEETDVEVPVSSALMQKIGKNINALIDGFSQYVDFTANDTFQIPPGVNGIFALVCGGGGGGGSGGNGQSSNATGNNGAGSGGRGATPTFVFVPVQQNDILTINIGLGGLGGQRPTNDSSDRNGYDGQAGQNSTLVGTGFRVLGYGGQGGIGGKTSFFSLGQTPAPSPVTYNGGFLTSSDSGFGGFNLVVNGASGGFGGNSIYNSSQTFRGSGHEGSSSARGGAGGGSGGNSIGKGGAGGHGSSPNSGSNVGYIATNAVRLADQTTITVNNAYHIANNYNVGEYVVITGFDSSFNGAREIIAVPTTNTIILNDPGPNATSVDVSGFIYPNDELTNTTLNKSGRGLNGGIGAGGGGGGSGGGSFNAFNYGAKGGNGGNGYILLAW